AVDGGRAPVRAGDAVAPRTPILSNRSRRSGTVWSPRAHEHLDEGGRLSAVDDVNRGRDAVPAALPIEVIGLRAAGPGRRAPIVPLDRRGVGRQRNVAALSEFDLDAD